MLIGLCALACGRPSERAAHPRAPVILISVDTLRSDHLPAYGYRGVETPNIDALRRDSILMTRAYSHVPLTLPSHVSILTGLLPTEHQVRNNVGFRFDAGNTDSLPALLRRNGYAAGAAVSSYVLRGETGLRGAFDFYDDAIPPAADMANEAQRKGPRTVAAALPWIDRNASRPFFFFLHLYEPHAPYTPPEPFRSRYRSPYDGEIAAADDALGPFIAALKRLGLYDRALIVFLSDHGEGLGEHGEEEHGIFLYREALQVPLMIKLPEQARGGTSVDGVAALIDVAPTIASAVGLHAQFRGADLLAPRRERDVYSETYYPRLQLGWSELTSLIRGDRHYVAAPSSELYALRSDPGERRNIIESDRRRAASMRETLASMTRDVAPLERVDPETARKLAALGYVGSSRAQHGPLPDPKQAIELLPKIRAAYAASLAARWSDAERQWRDVVAANPGNVDAWLHIGEAMARQGSYEGALEAYRRAISLSAGAPGEMPLDAGFVLLRMRRFDEARAYAEAGMASNPARAHELLARIALARGDLGAAAGEAERALAAGSDPGLLLLAAEIAARRGGFDGAESQLRLAADRARALGMARLPRLDFVRGDLYARMERPRQSEEAYRREIANFPDDLDAYANLAVVYALQNRGAEAERVLREMMARNPGAPARELAAKTRAALRE